MRVALEEFRAAYVAEADEHLAAIQGLLVDVERAAAEGKPQPRELRELMRLLHTIKGLSAMVGVDPIVTIAHRLEAIVRAADRAGGIADARAVDALMSGTRAIDARVKAVGDGREVAEAPPALLAELDALELPVESSEPAELPLDPAIASRLSTSERAQLREGVKAGRHALRVDFAPSPSRAERGINITTVRERIAAVAEIVKVLPLTTPASDNAPGGLVFSLVLLADGPSDAIADAADVAPSDIIVLLEPAPSVIRAPTESLEEDEGDLPRHGILRVEVARVDSAMEQLSSLIVTRSRLGRVCHELTEAGADTRELRAILADHAKQLRDLRIAILGLRMVPLTTVLDRLPLVVRGLGKTMGKRIQLDIDGGGAELDKTVGERLFPALLHLLRNAVDHGIEAPDVRRAQGKPEEGHIMIRCTTRNRQLEMRIEDDGRGIDRALIAGDGTIPDDATLLDLICRPGFSTRSEVDATSGRGVGMDIVRKAVRGLGGELAFESEPNRGTTWILIVPLTIAIVDAFTVSCAGERFVVPVPLVEEVIELEPTKVQIVPGGRLFARRNETLPVVELSKALALGENDGAKIALVVRRGREDPVAFAIDRVLGQQETVVRPLVDPLVTVPGISGSTDLGDGRATLVLDLVSLLAELEEAA